MQRKCTVLDWGAGAVVVPMSRKRDMGHPYSVQVAASLP